ncbi:MAG: tetraacyldisaccharide 4'-kinase, partial [Candidatus Omnitrophica bacterium]|nr:tetraacyldisaccharide 4'-kinase [Candidatus Omnitrophota bacterium]
MKNYFYRIITGEKKGFLPAILKTFLFILSLFYTIILEMIKLFYRQRRRRLAAKVISVGNITWGGAGKTPLVEYIAGYLKENGYRPAVLSRGYKRKDKYAPRVIYNGKNLDASGLEIKELGDEAYLLAEKLKDIPLGVFPDRIRCAKIIEEKFHPDTFILDDGFQHWKLFRDLDIVAIDATCPFGDGFIIPCGVLREPKSALRRADIFVITKTNVNPDTRDLKSALNKINPAALIVESVYEI